MNKKQLPTDIGGYQHVVSGLIEDGDIWVFEGLPRCFVSMDVFSSVEEAHASQNQGWNIYRKMPTPGHFREDGERFDGTVKQSDVESAVLSSGSKQSNPKDIVGSDKLPIHLWPTTATALGSLALLDGALKYGRTNYRAVGVRASIYYDALNRHMNAWFEGQDDDNDSGLPHLSHALACIAILVDAQAAGKLNDDRVYSAKYQEFAKSITPHVARLKAKHADREPKHYDINDTKPVASR